MPNILNLAGIDLPIKDGTSPAKDPFFDDNAIPRELLKKIAVTIKHNVALLIVGPTGAGKTATIKWIAEQTGNTYRRIQMTGSTDVDNLIGRYGLEVDRGTIWEDGILVRAMKEGEWLLLDEFNMALPEIVTLINSVLDDERTLRIDNKDGTTIVKAHENFRLFATMNPPDEYAGTKDLNLATKDRFAIIDFGYPDEEAEISIITKHTSIARDIGKSERRPKGMIERMATVAKELRHLSEGKQISSPISTRQLIQWAKFTKDLDVKIAFELAILGKCLDYERPILVDTVNRFFQNGESLKTYAKEEKKVELKKPTLGGAVGREYEALTKQTEEAKKFREIKEKRYLEILDKMRKIPTTTGTARVIKTDIPEDAFGSTTIVAKECLDETIKKVVVDDATA